MGRIFIQFIIVIQVEGKELPPPMTFFIYIKYYLIFKETIPTLVSLDNRRYKLILRLLDNRSSLSLDNKVLLYNPILKPIWTYGLKLGVQLNPPTFPTSKPRILHKICNPPLYVSNLTLHTDLNAAFVKKLAVKRYQKFHSTLSTHHNPLV